MEILTLLCLCFTLTNGAIPLDDLFPFGTQANDVILSATGDGSSARISLSQNFQFFGLKQDFLWVNVNGDITFKQAYGSYTPTCSPMTASYSMLSPFWEHIHYGDRNNIYYRQTTDANILHTALTIITSTFPDFVGILKLNWAFIATWYETSYWASCSNLTNTFQVALITDGTYSFVMFLYNEIQWSTSALCTGTGGTAGAKAGFDAGDGKNLYLIDGSCTPNIITVKDRSNVGIPGLWVFRVDNSTIQQPVATMKTIPPSLWPATGEPLANNNPLSDADGTPCGCNKATMWLDLMLVVDKSRSVGVGGVGAIGEQLATLLYGLNIAQSGTQFYTRIGLILFASDVQVLGDLQHYTNFNALFTDLNKLESYHSKTDYIVDIYQALNATQTIFETQTMTDQRHARRVVVLFASSYNEIGSRNPNVIAKQMKNSNDFIITVDYLDAQGTATEILGEIATQYMTFSSKSQSQLHETFNNINDALCSANCVCPASMTQVVIFDEASQRPTYYADCLLPFLGGTFAQFAEGSCEQVSQGTSLEGVLVSVTSQSKKDFLLASDSVNKTIVNGNGAFHTGLHRNNGGSWVWYGYNGTEIPLGGFQDWAPGFNANSTGGCVFLDKLSKNNWGSMTENCLGNALPYICQIRACDATYGYCDCSTWFNDGSYSCL